MPLRTISRAGECTARIGCATGDAEAFGEVRAWISWITAFGGRLRLLPLTKGMTQKEQRLLQPSWIFRMGRGWWDSPPWMGAERNSGCAKMSPVRIWAVWGEALGLETLPRWGATLCAPTKEWNGTF